MKNKTHSNEDLLHTDYSEGHQLREAIGFRTTVNWRAFNKKVPFADAKSKAAFKEAKREADRNFNNETVVRYIAQ